MGRAMSWIVIIDNGEDYSDNTHWTALVCSSLDDAKDAVAAFAEWQQKAHAEYVANDEDQYTLAPPFWGDHGDTRYGFRDPMKYSASWIEVPVWAAP